MTDPNVTYKLAFAELRETLGRVPTANELIPLHDEYKASYSEARDIRVAEERANAAASRPEFSREPAPQARTEARESGHGASESLSGPGIIPTREEAESVLTPYPACPALSQGLQEGARGPGGGLVAMCVKCGRLWERPVRTGRPAIWCETCRG